MRVKGKGEKGEEKRRGPVLRSALQHAVISSRLQPVPTTPQHGPERLPLGAIGEIPAAPVAWKDDREQSAGQCLERGDRIHSSWNLP